MPNEPLLSALCRYCNTNIPKYRCPGCLIRTCSLACSKKHKSYTQCTGVRDPTAYVKRSALLNPTKLNQDFNYLMNVERAMTRGPALALEALRQEVEGDGEEMKRRKSLTEVLEKTKGVVVKRAPVGMQRARENMTAIIGSKRKRKTLRWTVEWLVYLPYDTEIGIGNRSNKNNKDTAQPREPVRILAPRVPENLYLDGAFTQELRGEDSAPPSTTTTTTSQTSTNPLYISNKNTRRRFTESCRFFLKKPDVPANNPTLIELDPNNTLAAALKGRVVFEFPTILVVVGARTRGIGVLSGWEVIEGNFAKRTLAGIEDGDGAGPVKRLKAEDGTRDTSEVESPTQLDIPLIGNLEKDAVEDVDHVEQEPEEDAEETYGLDDDINELDDIDDDGGSLTSLSQNQ